MKYQQSLSQRLIEITSNPLQNYYIKYINTPYSEFTNNEYNLHTFIWDISSTKRLVLKIKDTSALNATEQILYNLMVIYHFHGICFFRRSIAHKTLPKSVISTMCQFAYNGIKDFTDHKTKKNLQKSLQSLA